MEGDHVSGRVRAIEDGSEITLDKHDTDPESDLIFAIYRETLKFYSYENVLSIFKQNIHCTTSKR